MWQILTESTAFALGESLWVVSTRPAFIGEILILSHNYKEFSLMIDQNKLFKLSQTISLLREIVKACLRITHDRAPA